MSFVTAAAAGIGALAIEKLPAEPKPAPVVVQVVAPPPSDCRNCGAPHDGRWRCSYCLSLR